MSEADMRIEDARRWMRIELRYHAADYMDCGEVQRTKLAEAYADAVGHEEEEIPGEWWDAAAEVADWWERLEPVGADCDA